MPDEIIKPARLARQDGRSTERPVAIVGGVRVPFCKMATDYSEDSLLDLLVAVLANLTDRYNLKGERLGEVAMGATLFHPEFWNLSREAVLKSGLSPETPAVGVQRACGTALEAAITIANKIALGQIEAGIAGGAESLSNSALFFAPDFTRRLLRFSKVKTLVERLEVFRGFNLRDLKPLTAAVTEPTTGLSMGEHCELMAQEWKIPRREQDELALVSHQNGVKAYERGFYKDLITPHRGVEKDNLLRPDTTLEKLSQLKPVFEPSEKGTLTAGNSSPLTDGAAITLLASESWAEERGLPVLAYLRDFETAAVRIGQEGLLMAPAYAAPPLLQRNGLSLQDFDFYEIHEAFAAQVLCTLRAWESPDFCVSRLGLAAPLGSIDRTKMNVAGGSVALGHPFGATGSRMLTTLAKLLADKGSGRGLLSVCTGGGMGTVALLER